MISSSILEMQRSEWPETLIMPIDKLILDRGAPNPGRPHLPCSRGRMISSIGIIGQRSSSMTINRLADKSAMGAVNRPLLWLFGGGRDHAH